MKSTHTRSTQSLYTREIIREIQWLINYTCNQPANVGDAKMTSETALKRVEHVASKVSPERSYTATTTAMSSSRLSQTNDSDMYSNLEIAHYVS